MKKHISLLLAILTIFAAMTAFVIPTNAIFDGSDSYVVIDLRSYDGKEIPFGKGKNGDCYYPIVDGVDRTFYEVYTWGGATITLQENGTKITASKANAGFITEFDKAPTTISSAISSKTMKYLVIRLKSCVAAENVSFSIVSQGNTYKKTFNVSLTGDWQTLALDLSGTGWTKKNTVEKEVVDEKTGEKVKKNVTVYEEIEDDVWDAGKFSAAGFRVDFPALGEEVTAEYIVEYYAFMADPNEKIFTGPIDEHILYIKGYAGNLFKPNATMTRA